MTRTRRGQAPREHTPLTDAVAAEVRATREAADLSQQEVAVLAGMSINTYRRLETGARPPTVEQVERAARALGLALSELIRRAESRLDDDPPGRGDIAFMPDDEPATPLRVVPDNDRTKKSAKP